MPGDIARVALNGGDDAAQVHVQTELEDVPHGGGRDTDASAGPLALGLLARGAAATARLLWGRVAVGVFRS